MAKIVTDFVPVQGNYNGICDWSAVMSDRDDGGAHQIGRGCTEQEAIDDLLEQIRPALATLTRKSTPKYEVIHLDAGVVLSGISKTNATKIAREMNKGTPRERIKRLSVRRVRA